MTNAQSKRYATRMVQRAEAKLAEARADVLSGRALESHLLKAQRSLMWAQQVRTSMDTRDVNAAYESADYLLDAAHV